MGSSPTVCTLVWVLASVTIAGGQINRYINPAWLEMDANSEYYPGGEVISQILRAYGLGDGAAGVGGPSPRYRSSVVDRIGRGGGGGWRSYPRNRIAANNLNNAYNYDSDPLALEYLDRNYDYADNTIRGSNMYRNTALDIPRRTRIVGNNMIAVPRTSYYSSDRDLPTATYVRSRSAAAAGDAILSQDLLPARNRGDATRIFARSTVAPDTDGRGGGGGDKRKS